MEGLSANLEDYLETVLNLVQSDGYARVSDIADVMDVSRPSVTQVIAKLAELGLVKHVPYGDVRLTSNGRKIAQAVAHKHELFCEFLTDILGIPKEIAATEACRLEHAIGRNTTERLAAFVEFVDAKRNPPKWLALFHSRDEADIEKCRECRLLRIFKETKNE